MGEKGGKKPYIYIVEHNKGWKGSKSAFVQGPREHDVSNISYSVRLMDFCSNLRISERHWLFKYNYIPQKLAIASFLWHIGVIF